MDYAIYEDRPRLDIWMKGVFILPPALLLLAAAIFSPTDSPGALYLAYGALAISLIMAVLFLLVMPTKYSVCNTGIRIKFRWPFTFDIPFDDISAVRNTRWSTVGINLPTNMSGSSLLEIARKRRMTVTISPSNRKAFTDNFEKAYRDWKQYRVKND